MTISIHPSAHALVFRNTSFSIIDRNSKPWLRLPQIGAALGYAQAHKVQKVYDRHAAEFTDSMTAVVKLPTAGGEQETRIFSLRGAHLLAMFARTPVAAEFRHWVLDILDREVQQPPAFDPSASHGEAIQFAMDHIRALELHAANPAKNPRPKWDEAEAHRIADGIVSAWMLRNNRWMLSFDHNGKPQLTMIPRDACVMTPEKMLSAINDPNGLYLAPETLFRFAKATISRLEHCHRHQKAKAEGGKVELRW